MWTAGEDSIVLFFKKGPLLLYEFTDAMIREYKMPHKTEAEIAQRYAELLVLLKEGKVQIPQATKHNRLPQTGSAIDQLYTRGTRCELRDFTEAEDLLLMSVKKTDAQKRALSRTDISTYVFPTVAPRRCENHWVRNVQPRWNAMSDAERAKIPLFEHYEEILKKMEARKRDKRFKWNDVKLESLHRTFLRVFDWKAISLMKFGAIYTQFELKSILYQHFTAIRKSARLLKIAPTDGGPYAAEKDDFSIVDAAGALADMASARIFAVGKEEMFSLFKKRDQNAVNSI